MARILLVLVALGLIAAGVTQWALSAWERPGPPAPYGDQSVILIAPHTPAHNVSMLLEQKGVIRHGLLFEFNLRVRGSADKIKAGEYAVPTRASMAGIAETLVAGKSIQHKLTAAEGLTSEMIWKLVKADPVLTGDAGPLPPEGSLLPETYLFTRGETRAGLLKTMHHAQEKFLAAHWSGRAAGLPLTTPRQAVILASLIEKETGLPEERRHIAGVFVNRLRKGMRLQTDPTIIYALTRGYPLGRGIRQSELEAATPYNTYVIEGLPPGPICNPGKDSISAALNPEVTDDLYFVASGHGGHVFSATVAEHARNVAALRARERGTPRAPEPASLEETTPVPDAALPKLPTLPKARHHRAAKKARHR